MHYGSLHAFPAQNVRSSTLYYYNKHKELVQNKTYDGLASLISLQKRQILLRNSPLGKIISV
jgi:hypothetical protein